MKDRLSSMSIFVGDYVGSINVRLMTLAERSAYVHLLCLHCQEGRLHKDPKKHAKLTADGGRALSGTGRKNGRPDRTPVNDSHRPFLVSDPPYRTEPHNPFYWILFGNGITVATHDRSAAAFRALRGALSDQEGWHRSEGNLQARRTA